MVCIQEQEHNYSVYKYQQDIWVHMTSEEITINSFMKWSKTEREIHKIYLRMLFFWDKKNSHFGIKKKVILALKKSYWVFIRNKKTI